MIKSDLIAKLAAEHPELTQREVERVVDTVFARIADAMVRGGRVELRGFGTFTVRRRDARPGRNPLTGETVAVRAKRVPFFKASGLLIARLNPSVVTLQPKTADQGRRRSPRGWSRDKAA